MRCIFLFCLRKDITGRPIFATVLSILFFIYFVYFSQALLTSTNSLGLTAQSVVGLLTLLLLLAGPTDPSNV